VLHRALVGFLSLVTRVFFRRVEVSGAENVVDGPVIFVGNHPNSLLDPVLVITTCRRTVRFAAKEVLFKGPLRPFLAALGAVPIKRRQDSVKGAKEDEPVVGAPERVDNSEAFAALEAVLAEGGAFGIFPEGISHTRPELAPLKTGAARIAIGAKQRGIDVKIVPVGLHYRRRDRMRSRVLVTYGKPIDVDSGDARELTAKIGLALRALTINVSDFETLRVLECARQLYQPANVDITLAQQAELMRRFIEHWERLKDDPEVRAMFGDVAAYQLSLRALGLGDKDLRAGDPTSFLARLDHVVRHALYLVILLPAAVPGFVIHAPVLAAAVAAAENLTSRGDVRATIKVVAATALTIVAYAVVGAFVAMNAGAATALTTIAALAVSGYATIRVLEKQGEARHAFATLLALFHLDDEIARLAAERERLRARVLELVDKHLGPGVPRIIDRAAHDDVKAWLDAEDAD
jgi:1-acyl-sn-glycerol-3-phosphate acyltransferase